MSARHAGKVSGSCTCPWNADFRREKNSRAVRQLRRYSREIQGRSAPPMAKLRRGESKRRRVKKLEANLFHFYWKRIPQRMREKTAYTFTSAAALLDKTDEKDRENSWAPGFRSVLCTDLSSGCSFSLFQFPSVFPSSFRVHSVNKSQRVLHQTSPVTQKTSWTSLTTKIIDSTCFSASAVNRKSPVDKHVATILIFPLQVIL